MRTVDEPLSPGEAAARVCHQLNRYRIQVCEAPAAVERPRREGGRAVARMIGCFKVAATQVREAQEAGEAGR